MEGLKDFINNNQERFLEELFGFLRIPSVSAKADNKESMFEAAEYAKDSLLSVGCDKVVIYETEGWPVLVGQKIIDPSLKTVLVYGHYDVQPAEPFELWDSPAFEPEIRDGKIYGRGADDDKGQLFMHVKAFEYLVSTNQLSCNVKFLLEGEEEIGSPSLEKFCAENKELLAADVILVSDTSMLSLDTPSLTTGLRGLAYFEIEVNGPNRDLHSGLYGGAVANPVNALSKMMHKLVDEKGRAAIPDFYKHVEEVSAEEREMMNSVPFSEKAFLNSIGLDEPHGEEGYTTIERLGIRPSLDLNGIYGGHTEEGAKTILPSKGTAKLSMRLVPNQDPEHIKEVFEKYIDEITPVGVEVKVNYLHGGHPYVLPIDCPEAKAAMQAMKQSFGKEPVPVRSGGSIPVVATFEKVLGIKTVLMGFGLESDAIHSPNENYPVANFLKGIETIPWFYKFYSEM